MNSELMKPLIQRLIAILCGEDQVFDVPIWNNGKLIVTDARVWFEFDHPEKPDFPFMGNSPSGFCRFNSEDHYIPPKMAERAGKAITVADDTDWEIGDQPRFVAKPEGASDKWTVKGDCHECEGIGFVTCDYDHEHDCETCQGKGVAECPSTEADIPVHVGPAMFSQKLLWTIQLVPNMKMCKVSPKDPCGFIFDGGRGLTMPLMPVGSLPDPVQYAERLAK